MQKVRDSYVVVVSILLCHAIDTGSLDSLARARLDVEVLEAGVL